MLLLLGVRVMVFKVTYNNISIISWQSVFTGGGNWGTWKNH
jgi:hypothetical protein